MKAPLSFRFAARELRSGVRGFRIFLACLALGVAAIAAAGSTAEAFRQGLASQASEILGGDLAVTRQSKEFTPAERAALERLPHRAGVMPHFTDENGVPVGTDVCSTVDTAWLVAGGLWAASFLRDADLMERARLLFDRIDWRYWTMPAASRACVPARSSRSGAPPARPRR